MFCTTCGQRLAEAARFCGGCGAAVAANETSAWDRCARDTRVSDSSPRRLVRYMPEKMISGVCAGFARYFDCDVTVMRILWLTISFLTGVGFLVYLAAWIILPKDYGVVQQPAVANRHAAGPSNEGAATTG